MIPSSAIKYFWDVDVRMLDEQKHERLIISRLLNFGRLEDWRWLVHTYGRNRLSTVLNSESRLSLRDPARTLAKIMFTWATFYQADARSS